MPKTDSDPYSPRIFYGDGATGPAAFIDWQQARDTLRDGLYKAAKAANDKDDRYAHSKAYGALSGTVASALASLGAPIDLAALAFDGESEGRRAEND